MSRLPTPTLRRNGDHMVNLPITFVAGGYTLAAILARDKWADLTDFGENPDATMTKAEVINAAKSHFYAHGFSELDTWREYVGDDDSDTAWGWAKEIVNEAFPTMTVRD